MNEMYRSLFDKETNRYGTNSVKWDNSEKVFGRKVLPMWVADMDFETAPAIVDALEARVRHGIFGYTFVSDEDRAAVVSWQKNRHHNNISAEWIMESPGVIDSLVYTLHALFDEGDSLILQTPVYGSFEWAVTREKRRVMHAPLLNTEAGWKMDLDAVEDCLKKGAKGLILCSPHNPVGRVWTRDELCALVNLLNRYGAQLICDEIHSDFELPGATHIPILTIPGTEKAVMLISATKTFNLAALRHSTLLAPDKEIREKILGIKHDFYVTDPTVLSLVAQRAAYEKGGEWLDALNEYLGENRDYVESVFDGSRGVSVRHIEGSYLMFVDFRALGADQDKLCEKLAAAGVGLNNGTDFGKEDGVGYMRMNLGTRRSNIEAGVERILKAVRGL